MHAEAPAPVRHLLQLSVLQPQLCPCESQLSARSPLPGLLPYIPASHAHPLQRGIKHITQGNTALSRGFSPTPSHIHPLGLLPYIPASHAYPLQRGIKHITQGNTALSWASPLQPGFPLLPTAAGDQIHYTGKHSPLLGFSPYNPASHTHPLQRGIKHITQGSGESNTLHRETQPSPGASLLQLPTFTHCSGESNTLHRETQPSPGASLLQLPTFTHCSGGSNTLHRETQPFPGIQLPRQTQVYTGKDSITWAKQNFTKASRQKQADTDLIKFAF